MFNLQPLCFVSAPKAYKDSANCSNSSLRKRQKYLLEHFNHTAGSSQNSKICQTAVMLKSYDNDEANNILNKAIMRKVDLNQQQHYHFHFQM